MTYYVYILACYRGDQFSCFYTGFTNNLKRRLSEHERNATEGKRKKFTGRFDEVKLVWWEGADTREAAKSKEKEVKKLSSTKKRKLAGDSI